MFRSSYFLVCLGDRAVFVSPRGRLVAVSQFNTVLGILVAYFTNYIIALVFASPGADGSMVAWRWMFGILAVPSVVFFFLVLQIPESPRWLVKQHRLPEALAILRRLGNQDADQLIREISQSLHEETARTHEPFYVPKYSRPILLAVMDKLTPVH